MVEPEHEVVRDVEPVPQPEPPIVEGGDCGACVLSGISGDSVRDVYDRQRPDDPRSFTRPELRHVLRDMQRDGEVDRVVTDTPVWLNQHDEGMRWGIPADAMATEWWRYLRMALDGGYVGLGFVRLEGDGRISERGRVQTPDHFVLFAGVRKLPRRDGDGETRSIYEQREVLVRCSSTRTPDERWERCDELLREHGGLSAMMVRPSG